MPNLFLKNRVRVYANLGILVLWTLTHEIEFLRLSIIFQLGHPEPPSFLFAGELAFAMVGGDTVRVSLGRLMGLNKRANTIVVVKSEGWPTVTLAFGQEIPNLS